METLPSMRLGKIAPANGAVIQSTAANAETAVFATSTSPLLAKSAVPTPTTMLRTNTIGTESRLNESL